MIDIGANLAHDSFDKDRSAVLDRAWAAGLEAVVITGSSRISNEQALTLCHLAPGRLFCTAGVHPHHASEWTGEDAALIRRLATHAEVVSLGECGLDYNRNFSPHPDQRRAFIAQLELAVELRKPVFLHQRDAHADFLPILRDYRAALVDACVHCFTDTRSALDDYLALDCYIGITGWVCDERRGAPLRGVVPHIPADRLLIETDAPYLLPRNLPRGQRPGQRDPSTLVSHPTDGRRNEPCYLPWIAEALAGLRATPIDLLAQQSSDNARRFFRLPSAANRSSPTSGDSLTIRHARNAAEAAQ